MNVIDTLLLAALAFTQVMFDLYFRESLGSPAAFFYTLNIGVVGSIPMWGMFGFIVLSKLILSYHQYLDRCSLHSRAPCYVMPGTWLGRPLWPIVSDYGQPLS